MRGPRGRKELSWEEEAGCVAKRGEVQGRGKGQTGGTDNGDGAEAIERILPFCIASFPRFQKGIFGFVCR